MIAAPMPIASPEPQAPRSTSRRRPDPAEASQLRRATTDLVTLPGRLG